MNPSSQRSIRAFTLIDLGVVVLMLLIVAGVLVPACSRRTHQGHSRAQCSSNLRQIGLAMKMYANEELRTNAYPRALYVPGAPPTAWSNAESPNPFVGPNPPDANDVTASVFLLLRTQDITTHQFICPVTDGRSFEIATGKSIQDYSNFRSQVELSYSFQNPYPTKAAVERGFQYNDSMSPDFAIAADINPGVNELLSIGFDATQTEMRTINSPNHNYDGQNVLYADGHVGFMDNPFAGTQNDNIYTHGPNPPKAHQATLAEPIGLSGSPADANDSILLPTWDRRFPMPARLPAPITPASITLRVLTATLVLAGSVALLAFRASRRQRAKRNAL